MSTYRRNKKNILIHFSLETPKRVTGKQWKPRSDATECDVLQGSPLFANSLVDFSLDSFL